LKAPINSVLGDASMETIAAIEPACEKQTDPRAGKYLTFALGGDEFAIQALRVREITGVLEVTAVPRMPAHVKGVINFSGKIIPVLDLGLKLGLPEVEYTQRTCMIVAQIRSNAGNALMGVIVDAVSEVLTFESGEIEDAPTFGVADPYLLGIARSGGKVKILLDIDEVLAVKGLGASAPGGFVAGGFDPGAQRDVCTV